MEMDDALKGNTADDNLMSPKEVKASEKKKAYAAMVEISNTAKSIATAMDKTNRLAEQAQLISVAQTLGKNDILEDLLASMSSDG